MENMTNDSMSSLCVPSRLGAFAEDPYLYTTWYINLCVITFGLIGNLLAFIVHLKLPNKIGMNYILVFLSAVDFLLLAAVFFTWTVYDAGWLDYDKMSANSTLGDHLFDTAYNSMLLFQLLSIWTIVYLSIDRYIAICHPMRAMHMCSVGRAKKGLVALLCACLLYFLPWKVLSAVAKGAMRDDYVEWRRQRWYIVTEYAFTRVMDVLLLLVIPLLLLLVLNLRLLWAISAARRERVRLTFSEKKGGGDQTLAAAINVAAMVTLFLITQVANITLFFLLVTYTSACEGHYHDLHELRLSDAKNVCVCANSALNICIYCLFYRKFRLKFLEMFMCPKNETSFSRLKQNYTTATTVMSDV